MGIGEREIKRKSGKVTKSRTFTVYVDTGKRYANGRKIYKRVVRSLGSVHAVSKAQAQEVYDRMRTKYKTNKYLHNSPCLADFVSRYIAHKRDAEGKKSWQRDVYSLNNLLCYFGTDIKLSEIDSKSIDEYKVDRQKTVSKKTVNNELECLRNLFFLAETWEEFAGKNPVSKAGLIKKIIRDKRKPPTPEEETLIMSRLNPYVRCIFKFAANTGMRISEVINLETDQIHSTQYFEEGRVKKIKVAKLNPSDTKTGQGYSP
ncbi:MAG: tyrosine-type recombinase/integrase [Thermodesulfobacteriota bacterium]